MNDQAAPERNIVCISGTNRPGNYTSMALAVMVEALQDSGETLTVFDAREMQLDFPGHGETEDARQLKEAVAGATAVVIASPEYHGGVCAHTKLVIENLGFPSVLAGKPVALTGVAAGRIGAIKSLEQLRAICSHVGAVVLPGAVSIAGVRKAFDEDGNCQDASSAEALRNLADALVEFIDDFVCPKFVLESMVREDAPPWAGSL
ncbi:MAG: NAD(P)H-dependent oxidoreductase [Xanthomonadales bacterium]|nr:NAD(P)H-dependent oxidoreductase [Xanthomonadales bacterium]